MKYSFQIHLEHTFQIYGNILEDSMQIEGFFLFLASNFFLSKNIHFPRNPKDKLLKPI